MHELLPKGFAELSAPVKAPFTASERVYWLYLLSAFVLAAIVFVLQTSGTSRSARGFLSYLFPKEIYWHRSTFVDFSFFGVNKIFYWLLVVPFFFELPEVSRVATRMLTRLVPGRVIADTPSIGFDIAFTLVTAVAVDFGLFLGHWLMHKVPLLWEFHKVHHSAKVLTPVTVYRQHPIDDIVNVSLSAACGGVAQGAFILAAGRSPHVIAMYGLNALVLAFYLFGYNLRHSHIWLSYGPRVSQLFISPAQHQVHHSDKPIHFDKNMGFIFSLWDRAFGTLYVPLEKEDITFGLGDEEEDAAFDSFWRLYTRPFVSVFRNRSKMLVMDNRTRAVVFLVMGLTLAVVIGAISVARSETTTTTATTNGPPPKEAHTALTQL